MSKMSELVEVTIEKLVYGGSGMARLDTGRTVFVDSALPGEKIIVRIARRRKGVLLAEPVEVISASPYRALPPCRGEKECTGATWAHISYNGQLKFKEEILRDTLRHIAGIEAKRLLTIYPSPKKKYYRLRTQFNVRLSGDRQHIGFFRRGTYDLVEVENSFLLHPIINKILLTLRKHTPRLPLLEEIHVNVSPNGEAHILFFSRHASYSNMEDLFVAIKEDAPELVGLSGYAGRRKVFSLGRDHLILEMGDISFRVTEGNFYQVNWEQNENMVRTVTDFAAPSAVGTVLDLYCGIGNFSLPLAKKAARVIGIESGYSAVEDARANAVRNGLTNAEFIADDLQKGLKTLIQRKVQADVVVLDPPRAGATLKTLERILAFLPKKIIYVSCNPSTLARDLKYFRIFGFSLNRLQPIDMFPYTYHIECVAEMVREG